MIDEGWHSESELKELGWTASYSQNTWLHCRSIFDLSHICKYGSCMRHILLWLWNSSHCITRAKIQGAKSRCMALGDSHTRPTYQSQCCTCTRIPWCSPSPISLCFTMFYLWRRNAYDGELEFFVVLSEKAKRTEESSYEEEHRKRQKACKMFCFYNDWDVWFSQVPVMFTW